MGQIVKCKKCKRIIPTGQKVGAILSAGGLAFLGKKVIKNGGKIIEVAAKVIKK